MSSGPLMPAQRRAVRRVPARVGLVGNPSDLHRGAVLAVPIPELMATVEVGLDPVATGPVELRGPGFAAVWPDLPGVRAEVAASGHPPGAGIITSSLLRCLAHLAHLAHPGDDRRSAGGRVAGAWTITWSTEIPRSVGLAGSSALAVGVIEAVASVLGAHLDPLVVAALALAAETEDLGIIAGWQDRVVQAVGAPVLVDAARTRMIGPIAVPAVERVRWPAGVEVLLGWLPDAAEDSGAQHARTPTTGVAGAMAALADAARSAAGSADAGDPAGLERGVRTTWSIRSVAVPLRADHAALVDAVAATGVAATTPGSGGSVAAVIPDRSARPAAVAALDARGARWLVSRPG